MHPWIATAFGLAMTPRWSLRGVLARWQSMHPWIATAFGLAMTTLAAAFGLAMTTLAQAYGLAMNCSRWRGEDIALSPSGRAA